LCFLSDCSPSWVKTNNNNKPYDGTKVYAEQGGSFTFDWRYNAADGYNLQFSKWTFAGANAAVIATQSSGQSPTPNNAYKSRVTFPSGASLKIDNLQYPADQGKYECDLSFDSAGAMASLIDAAQLIVIGK